MTLIDELLYEIEGRAAVDGDVATVRLEGVLAKLRRCKPAERTRLLEQVTRLRDESALDVRAAETRRARAIEKVATWETNVATATGTLKEQAQERVDSARGDVVSIDEEIAEYRATVERLSEVHALIAGLTG
jgi:type I site-specific restriction endonuclease